MAAGNGHGDRQDRGAAGAAGGGCWAPLGQQAAIADSCGDWDSAIEALEAQAAALDRNLQGAAVAYSETDQSAMPGRG